MTCDKGLDTALPQCSLSSLLQASTAEKDRASDRIKQFLSSPRDVSSISLDLTFFGGKNQFLTKS